MDITFLAMITCIIGYGVAAQTDFAYETEDNTIEFEKCFLPENIRMTRLLHREFLVGKWVSLRCETRTGPEYLVRSYTFNRNGTFSLLQVFFGDESCASSQYSILAHGTYDHKSMDTLNYVLNEVTVVVHDVEVAKKFSTLVNEVCPGMTNKFWKPNKEYVIYRTNKKKYSQRKDQSYIFSNEHVYEDHIKSTAVDGWPAIQTDPKCLLDLLQLSFDELKLIRVYKRMVQRTFQKELITAETRLTRTVMHTSFQLPLVLFDESSKCYFCSQVASSTNMHIPIFHAKPQLPLSLCGEWISETCEGQQAIFYRRRFPADHAFDLFSIKTFRFDETTGRWHLETRYYSNYICTTLVAVYQSYGHYFKGRESRIMFGATDLDFEVEKSYLVIKDKWFLNKIATLGICNFRNNWKLDVRIELESRLSCPGIQLSAPIGRNIARLDLDEHGSFLLYLGNEDTITGRPTAYDYPLVQCKWKARVQISETDSTSFTKASSFLLITLCVTLYIVNGNI